MEELTLLCAQELMDDLSDTASLSDENKEKEQNMNLLTLLYAQNLMDDLLESSSSSDDDDEVVTLLGYAKLLQKSDNITGPTKYTDVTSPKPKVINLHSGSTVSAMFQKKEITIIPKHNVEAKVDVMGCNILCPLTESDLKIPFCKEQVSVSLKEDRDPMMSLCNPQDSPFDESIIDSLSENEFKQYFNISRESVTYLFDKFSCWYYKGHKLSVENSSIKTTVLSFLWFCANPVSFESVARMFNASLLETKQSFNIILDFFDQELAPEVIKLPRSYIEKEAIAKDFEKIEGFPNVLGCLAESSLSLKIPELVQTCGSSQLYIKGVCDSNMKFSNIKIRFSNNPNDDTFIENDLPKLCFPKYHLLGEVDCPIRDHLMIPYENSEQLSESEKYFNTKLSRTHIKIKNAFAMLRNRFRQFNYLDFNNVEILSKFIIACCILHNICIDKQDFFDVDKTKTDDDAKRQLENSLCSANCDDFLKDLGLMKRYELTHVLFRSKKYKV